jgi:hypothetical protein
VPALVVPNTVQVRLIWTVTGTPFAVNVLHFRNVTGVVVNQVLADNIATEIETAWGLAVGVSGNINSATGITRVDIRNLDEPSQPEYSGTVTGAVGNGSAEMLPKQVSLVATLRTALAGRSYRGRVYVPGFTESANSAGGVASVTAMSIAEGLVGNIRSGMAGLDLLMGVVSTRFNGAPRLINVITDVVSVQVRDNQWDNQRRRNIPGIGA